MPLQASAARTSSITSKSKLNNKSPIKKFQKDARKLLPTQKAYLDQKKEKKPIPLPPDELSVTDYNAYLDFQMSGTEDLLLAMRMAIKDRWSEWSSLHTKFMDRIAQPNGDMEQMIISLRGLPQAKSIELLNFRKTFPSLIITTTIYTIFSKLGHTFVDKTIEMNLREGKIKKFVISNASPIISRSLNQYQSGKISYGYENMEVLVESNNYLKLIQDQIREATSENKPALEKYLNYLHEHPTDLYLTFDRFTKEEITVLINCGFITLTSNHLNEIEELYRISYPGCGIYLKLVNEGRVWLTKTLSKQKNKQLLEAEIWQKWQGYSTITGELKVNNFKKPFYGYDLNWVLADCLGAGIVEVFNTPVGRGWRLTGKV